MRSQYFNFLADNKALLLMVIVTFSSVFFQSQSVSPYRDCTIAPVFLCCIFPARRMNLIIVVDRIVGFFRYVMAWKDFFFGHILATGLGSFYCLQIPEWD